MKLIVYNLRFATKRPLLEDLHLGIFATKTLRHSKDLRVGLDGSLLRNQPKFLQGQLTILTLSSIYTHFNTLMKIASGRHCGKR